MKKLFLTGAMFVSCTFFTPTAKAQSAGGFFNQKGTQRKYMLEQIALYQIYLGHVKKGYDITRTGLRTAGDIKSGDLRLHREHFEHLETASAAVRSLPQITQTLNYAKQTRFIAGHTLSLSRSMNQGSYIERVIANLFEDMNQNLAMLEVTLAGAGLKMNDDERIRRINGAMQAAIRQLSFAKQFSDAVKYLQNQKDHGRLEHEQMKILYHLP